MKYELTVSVVFETDEAVPYEFFREEFEARLNAGIPEEKSFESEMFWRGLEHEVGDTLRVLQFRKERYLEIPPSQAQVPTKRAFLHRGKATCATRPLR